jgi:Domain of unknown function (DUF4184)
MPFTFAHPAAAVPLARPLGRFGVMSALVIGSMTPDIAFLLPIGVSRAESHSLAGLFWCNLPLGWACYVIYHLLMKRPLIHLLPAMAFARLEPFATNDWEHSNRSLLPVLVSVLAGAITHLIWDSFTHRGSWAVENFAWLQLHLFTGGGFWIYLYVALQWVSSVVGLGLLARWAVRWVQTTPPPPQAVDAARRWRWPLFAALAALTVASGAAWAWPDFYPEMRISAQELLIRSLVGAVSGFGAALFVFCLWWNFHYGWRGSRRT